MIKKYLMFRMRLQRTEKASKVLMFVGFVLVISLFLYNHLMSQKEQTFIEQNLSERKRENQKWIADYGNDPSNIAKEIMKIGTVHIKGVEAYEKGDMQHYLDYENEMFENYLLLEPLQSTNPMMSMAEQLEQEYGFNVYQFIYGKELLNKSMIKKKINPVSIRYGTQSLSFILSLLHYVTSFIGITFFLMIFGFSSLKDIEKTTINFIGVQPLKRRSLFMADFLLFIGQAVLFYGVLLVFAFLLGWIFGGQLSWDYPILVDELSTATIIRPIWQVILISSGLFILNLVIGYLLLVWVLLFTRKLIVSLLSVTVLLGCLTVVAGFPLPSEMKHVSAYNPFAYFQPATLMVGRSYEPINKIEESYGVTDEMADTFEGGDYRIMYENVSYYIGANKLQQTRNDLITYQKGLISLGTSIVSLLVFVGYSYKKRMCT